MIVFKLIAINVKSTKAGAFRMEIVFNASSSIYNDTNLVILFSLKSLILFLDNMSVSKLTKFYLENLVNATELLTYRWIRLGISSKL